MAEVSPPSPSRDSGAGLLHAAIDGFNQHAFLTLDPAGLITSWSLGAERLFGISRQGALGNPVSLIFTPEDRDAGVLAQLLKRADSEGSVSGRRWLTHGGGNRRYVNATIVAVRRDSGVVGYAAVAHEQPFPADDEVRTRDMLTAQVADATRRLSDSNILLTTEIADRTHAEAGAVATAAPSRRG